MKEALACRMLLRQFLSDSCWKVQLSKLEMSLRGVESVSTENDGTRRVPCTRRRYGKAFALEPFDEQTNMMLKYAIHT